MVSSMGNDKSKGGQPGPASAAPGAATSSTPEPDDALIKSELVLSQVIILDQVTLSSTFHSISLFFINVFLLVTDKKAPQWDKVKEGVLAIQTQMKDLESKLIKTTPLSAELALICTKIIAVCYSVPCFLLLTNKRFAKN